MRLKINLFGPIGYWWKETDHKSIASQLDGLGVNDTVELHINSVGGSLFDGVGIYNSLKQFSGKVVVYVDALAASAASIIALAGDEIIMGEGSVMMIHNPWLVTMADADGHRKNADILDLLSAAMVGIYKAATGKGEDEIKQMLADETYMTAEEAVKHGFATRVDGRIDEDSVAALAQFNMDTSPQVPAWLRDKVVAAVRNRTPAPQNNTQATPKGANMTGKKKKKDASTPSAAEPAEAVVDTEQVESAARMAGETAERKRQHDIRAAVSAARLDGDFVDALITDGVTLAAASASIFAELAKSGPAPTQNATPTGSGITVGETSGEKFGEGVQNMLLAKAGVEEFEPENNFNGYTMLEICRMSLDRRGVRTRGMSKMDIVGKAFTMPQAAGGHTTDDFTTILSGAATKSVMKAYTEAEETFGEWTYKGILGDFKINSRVDLDAFPSLPKVSEGAEFHNATIGERKEQIQLATYGEIFPISRQAIINDDLNLFSRLPKKMGRAAKRTVGDLVYAVLTGNPKMADGTALFHASHGNLTSKSLTVDNLVAAEVAMAAQSDPTSKRSLGISPAFILTPIALKRAAIALVAGEFEPGTDDPNPIRDIAKVIGEHRLDDASAKNWYMTASPQQYDTVEVGYLDGNEMPRVERQENWTTDGVSFKVAIDATAAPMDYRSMRKDTPA